MPKPRLLDLFCGAGGAAVGYHRAGFEVVGVDIKPQKHYPFEFHQADALGFLAEHGREYDVIHASPPCQAYSEATPVEHRGKHPDLIGAVRELLNEAGQPYVIENVENARHLLINPIMLCGTMFGLPLWRHRYFETEPALFSLLPPCDHSRPPVSLHPGSHTRALRGNERTSNSRRAMGIDWMSHVELHQAIPPAYTEFIGRQLIACLGRVGDA